MVLKITLQEMGLEEVEQEQAVRAALNVVEDCLKG
jgi:hypothetical protein